MPIPTPIEQNEFMSFFQEEAELEFFYKNNLPSKEIKKFSLVEDIDYQYLINAPKTVYNFNITEEVSNVIEINLNSKNKESSNFFEWKLNINPCEDYIPPPPNVIIKPNPPPTPPPPPKLYYFTGIDPDTKKLVGWTSTVRNSKKPDGASQNYLSVTRMTQ